MRVILLRDVRHTGERGETVDVKPGYARNYLVPRGLALQATPGNQKYYDQQKTKIDLRHQKEREGAEEAAKQLEGLSVEIAKRVGETETLYGSVTATEVAEALLEKGVTIDRRRIDLEGGIKTVGEHRVRVEFHSEVSVEIIVNVVPES